MQPAEKISYKKAKTFDERKKTAEKNLNLLRDSVPIIFEPDSRINGSDLAQYAGYYT